MSKTIFIDLDGTIVKHNYTPTVVPDELLPGALDFLKQVSAEGHYLVLTTNRNIDSCKDILTKLMSEGVQFHRQLFDLPVGIRILINDTKGREVRAIAIPVERDAGLESVVI